MITDKKPIILIVDDVPKNIQVLGTILNKFEYEIAVAMNGHQALETIKVVKPDLILLDIMMPVMNGHEVCRRLKESDETKEIPVIFLTAKVEPDDIVKGFELGAVDYVTKPFIASELMARVKTHLALKTTRETLKAEIESKNKFFSIMSHDLRGAFGIIMNFIELIQDLGDDLDQDELEGFLKDIANTSKNTLNLLENLLKWARSQTGKIKFEPTLLRVNDLVDEAVANVKQMAQTKNIVLESNVSDHELLGDKNMLLMIIRNLVSNAIKFTPDNGKVVITSEKKDESIKITVSDTGVGMDSEKLQTVFRVEKTSSMRGTNNEMGTGLGLILCKEFVQKNQGEIGIESTPKEGTDVWFTVPVSGN